METKMKDIKVVVAKMTLKKCGAVTCIFNVDSKCSQNECELFETGLKQED